MTRGPQDRAARCLLVTLLVLVAALAGAALGAWHDLGMLP